MPLTLKAARINKGYSQKSAAMLLKISVDTLSNYERYTRYPTVFVARKMSSLYEVPYNDLIFCPDVTENP